jgi:predicted O-methyltransferase YrrM
MYGFEEYTGVDAWQAVDRYIVDSLVGPDAALDGAVDHATASGLPKIEVAANQGKLLHLFARMIGAKRILEFGTLGGYSAIWFGRAVGPHGHVTTFELDEDYAQVARENLERAGLSSRVHVVVGPAIDSVQALIDEGAEPFDLVFIDADKPSTPAYLSAALQLTRPGSVIIGDNVIRDGQVANPESDDERVQGMRRFVEQLAAEPRLDATALQTVGSKGWDGFALALVVDPEVREHAG